jgi:hypothetical protein
MCDKKYNGHDCFPYLVLKMLTGERQIRTLVSLLFRVFTNDINWNNNCHTMLVVTDSCSSSITSSDSLITKVGVEESIVNAPEIRYRSRISCLNLTSLFALFVFFTLQTEEWCVHNRLLTPTLRIHLNEHPI